MGFNTDSPNGSSCFFFSEHGRHEQLDSVVGGAQEVGKQIHTVALILWGFVCLFYCSTVLPSTWSHLGNGTVAWLSVNQQNLPSLAFKEQPVLSLISSSLVCSLHVWFDHIYISSMSSNCRANLGCYRLLSESHVSLSFLYYRTKGLIFTWLGLATAIH